MRYLVTGGGGFIGSHLVDRLADKNEVLVIDDFSTGSRENLFTNNNSVSLIEESVQKFQYNQVENFDGIFHLAAQTSVPLSLKNYYGSSSNNLTSTMKVLDWCRELNIPVVYSSSSAVYGNLPLGNDEVEKYDIMSPYAQDKLTMEDFAKMAYNVYGVSSIGLRLFNVYGPRQDPENPYSGVITIFIDRILNNMPVTVTGGFQTRDFVYVQDVVDVMIKSMGLLHKKEVCEVLNVGTGLSISINELLVLVKNLLNAEPKVVRDELPKSDPEQSAGTFSKLKRFLSMDVSLFTDLETG